MTGAHMNPEPAGNKRHKHWFPALWVNFGPYGRQDVHFHPCVEDGCFRVVMGEGRECGGPATPHHRETLR